MKNIIKISVVSILPVLAVIFFISCGGGAGSDSSPVDNTVSIPQSVQAIPGEEKVGVSWNTASNANSYNIYWGTGPGVTTLSGTKISGITTTSYIQTGLTNGTSYYYVVTATGSSGESAISNETSVTPKAAVGAVNAAVANFAYDSAMAQAGTYAKLESVVLTKGLFNKTGEPAQKGIDGLTYNSGGTWTSAGANGESVSITFWDASIPDTTTLITQDISDWSNYNQNGPLNHLLSSSLTLDIAKVKIKIQIQVNKTFTSGALLEIITTLQTGIIAFNDDPAASYVMDGTGSAKLANGDNITLNNMTITVSNMGADINGTSTTSFPVSGEVYTIVCTFNQNGCETNSVLNNNAEVGSVKMEGPMVIFTDSDGNKTLLSN